MCTHTVCGIEQSASFTWEFLDEMIKLSPTIEDILTLQPMSLLDAMAIDSVFSLFSLTSLLVIQIYTFWIHAVALARASLVDAVLDGLKVPQNWVLPV